MRYLSLLLQNYVGIKNGLNINEIFIDLSKCKNRLILIRGDNGSGKSTILSAISPLPDSNDNFIPELIARKKLQLIDNDIVYDIEIVHGIKASGERDTTKAYISKLVNEEWISLNPNGNVGSFKDMVDEELGLDPNFLALSQLTSDDKGLVSKKPAERKKFINSIISSLDVYNNINKILIKKSSVCKSLMNSLITRLQQLGDKEILTTRLQSLNSRVDTLNNEKQEYVELMVANKQGIYIKDPDGSIQKRYEELIQTRNLMKERDIDPLLLQLNNYKRNLKITDNDKVLEIYQNIVDLKLEISIEIQLQESKVNTLLIDKENEAKVLNTKIQKLNSLQCESNYKNLITYIKQYREQVSYCESIFDKIGIRDAIKISKDEYIIGLNTINEMREIVEIFRGLFSYSIINEAFECIVGNSYPDMSSIEYSIDDIKNQINQLERDLQENEILVKISSKLSMRPTSCTIDSCEFIKDAVIANQSNPIEKIDIIIGKLEESNTHLESLLETHNEYIQINKCINYINNIIRLIDRNKSILNKLPNGNMFSDIDIFMKRLMNFDTFDDISKLYSYIDCANVFEEYKVYKDKLYELEMDYKVYEEKNKALDEISSDIEDLNNKLNNLYQMIEDNSKLLMNAKEQLIIYSNKEIQYKTYIDMSYLLQDMKDKDIELYNSILGLEEDMTVIKQYINLVNIYSNKINTVNSHLSSIEDERDKIKHALTLHADYNNELEQYKAKYDLIETVKYYSSPTKKGIQLIFMEVYMHQILELANTLLMSFFDGRFALQKFELNENEFRIPVQREGITNDDITSMSSGEVAIMSMIISFSLLFKSSSKYNILKLDEIDAALDSNNRLYFANLLESQSECLGVEQIFLISHNNEINATNCDVIVLKVPNNDYIEGNIIYQYK